MSAPNVVNVATINSNSIHQVVTTSSVKYLGNAAASSKVFKLTSLYVANYGAAAASITVYFGTNSAVDTARPLFYQISIPINTTLVLIDKNSGINIKEDEGIYLLSSAATTLMASASWEEIS